jgi:predicted hydrocarbon binding protein
MAAQKLSTERWIENLMGAMDAHLDQGTKAALMESCGRACARLGAIGSAEKCQGDVDKLVTTLERWIGEGNAQRDGDVVHVVYPRCLCHLVAKGPERLPDTYCLCSRGWLKEMFETVVNHPVEVALLESVKRGAKQCRFTVTL